MGARFWIVVLVGLFGGNGCGEDQLFNLPNDPQSLGPIIVADPPEFAFGSLEADTTATQVFMIGNIGNEPLVIESVTLAGSNADQYGISADQASGHTIKIDGPYLPVTVTFAPRVRGSLSAVLEIASNDPEHAPLAIHLHGVGVVDSGEAPMAVCEVNPQVVTPPFDTATFIGTGSFDPSGNPLVRYAWSLTAQPAGSAVSMPNCGNAPDCAGFQPDVAGTYTGLLTVWNEAGLTDSCTVSLEAVPDEDLWIEMYWTHEKDDMDLHLLAPRGSPRTGRDCYFENCIRFFGIAWIDWGQLGYKDDDPRLDLDDIKHTGPENINLDAPEDGVFTVLVHDYPESPYPGANDVTVNVYVNGVNVFNDTRTISGEDSDTYFCEIEWPGGAVTPL